LPVGDELRHLKKHGLKQRDILLETSDAIAKLKAALPNQALQRTGAPWLQSSR
jgi:hypothetical protein